MANVNQAVQANAQPAQVQLQAQPAQATSAIEPNPEAVVVGGEKKPIWKKWWLWAIVAILVIVIAGIVIYLLI